MRGLVIGGCGFVGSHVVDVLREHGHDLRVLDRRPEVYRTAVPGVEYVNADFSDAAALAEALVGVDVVVHVASSTVPYTSNLDPISDVEDNLISTIRLLEAMRKQGVSRIVYFSSGGAVYGIPQTAKISEDHPLNPLSSYGIVKVTVEKYLSMYSYLYGLRYVSLRASNPYGPRQGHRGIQGVIGTFLWRAASGEPIEIWGDGRVVRDFLHVRDLAKLCAFAFESTSCGVFNAGAGYGLSISEVFNAVEVAVGRKLSLVFKSGRNFDAPKVVLDISRARDAFGWTPTIPLPKGIAETWNWVQKQPVNI